MSIFRFFLKGLSNNLSETETPSHKPILGNYGRNNITKPKVFLKSCRQPVVDYIYDDCPN
jgi:hypothetical protein